MVKLDLRALQNKNLVNSAEEISAEVIKDVVFEPKIDQASSVSITHEKNIKEQTKIEEHPNVINKKISLSSLILSSNPSLKVEKIEKEIIKSEIPAEKITYEKSKDQPAINIISPSLKKINIGSVNLITGTKQEIISIKDNANKPIIAEEKLNLENNITINSPKITLNKVENNENIIKNPPLIQINTENNKIETNVIKDENITKIITPKQEVVENTILSYNKAKNNIEIDWKENIFSNSNKAESTEENAGIEFFPNFDIVQELSFQGGELIDTGLIEEWKNIKIVSNSNMTPKKNIEVKGEKIEYVEKVKWVISWGRKIGWLKILRNKLAIFIIVWVWLLWITTTAIINSKINILENIKHDVNVYEKFQEWKDFEINQNTKINKKNKFSSGWTSSSGSFWK